MMKILLISLLLFSKSVFSQISDSFSDGDFSNNPAWSGDMDYFHINAQKQLQSKGQQIASQIISLSSPSEYSLNASWELLVQLNFDPTASNFVRIYLISDKEDLKGGLNGYFIQIGETGALDGFHLYRQTGMSATRIITGPSKTRAKSNLLLAKIKVTRDGAGKWNLYSDVTGGRNFNLEGSILDNTFTASAYAGVYCKYATASRYNQYIFDDFIIEDLVPDITPPTLKKVAAIDSSMLELTFSEPLDAVSATSLSNYSLSNGYDSPTAVVPASLPHVYRLKFSKEFGSGDYSLTVSHVKDKKGNIIQPNSSLVFKYIKPYTARHGDMVINEIFANPTGNVTLPQKEFVEVWNTSNEYILTKGWKYADQSSIFTFDTDTIKPNEHFILCAKPDTGLFKPFGKVISLSPWPSLNNDKNILTLTDNNGKLIDQVAYKDSWYKDDLKKKGGFSLELIDPNNVCTGIQNWQASGDVSGGTPGRQNSVYQLQISAEVPELLSADIIDSVTVSVKFSKSVDSLSAVQLANYTINNNVGSPDSVIVQSPAFKSVTLKFSKGLQRGIENTLKISNLSDCAGNTISADANSARLFIARKILKNDILISELLFNPKVGGVDFVEIYNNADHVLDVSELQLANSDTSGRAAGIKVLSTKNLLIPPKTYWVISTSTTNIQTSYFCPNPDNFIQLSSLPAFNNDKGTVILLSNNVVVDRLNYNAKIHHPLIKNEDGISIERVSFSVDTNHPDNFKSAAAAVGFATPTYKNSQQTSGNENFVRLKTKTFSPDGDGYEDVLNLDYQLTESGGLATVNVYSDKGILIRKLLQNQSVGTSGNVSWDGLDDNGNIAKIGMYVVLFDVFDLKGKAKRFKSTCVLAGKLD